MRHLFIVLYMVILIVMGSTFLFILGEIKDLDFVLILIISLLYFGVGTTYTIVSRELEPVIKLPVKRGDTAALKGWKTLFTVDSFILDTGGNTSSHITAITDGDKKYYKDRIIVRLRRFGDGRTYSCAYTNLVEI